MLPPDPFLNLKVVLPVKSIESSSFFMSRSLIVWLLLSFKFVPAFAPTVAFSSIVPSLVFAVLSRSPRLFRLTTDLSSKKDALSTLVKALCTPVFVIALAAKKYVVPDVRPSIDPCTLRIIAFGSPINVSTR